MTALKPIENRRVRGVPAERYPLNQVCAHPGCTDAAVDPHHIFPRSQIGNDSWFVEVEDLESPQVGYPFPHVTGLCRLHHDDLEEHRAWVKLEDGHFNWYVRKDDEWLFRGKLNPQPGSQEGRPKRKRKQGDERRQRQTISLRVPSDAEEEGAGLLDDAIAQAEEAIRPGEDPRSPYYTIMDSLNAVILGNVEKVT